jgi:hypothetical protein
LKPNRSATLLSAITGASRRANGNQQ